MGGCEWRRPAGILTHVLIDYSHRITAKESFGMSLTRRCTPLTTPAEIINSFLHYLDHYQILATDPHLACALSTTLDLSPIMLSQITIAQHLCDALPGSVTQDAWHALALDAWLRGPMRRSDEAWERHGAEMTRRIEAEFTDAREESMQRNILEGLEAEEDEGQVEEDAGQVDEHVEDKGGAEEYHVDWQSVETPGECIMGRA